MSVCTNNCYKYSVVHLQMSVCQLDVSEYHLAGRTELAVSSMSWHNWQGCRDQYLKVLIAIVVFVCSVRYSLPGSSVAALLTIATDGGA